MASFAAQMLDELMGRNRNLNPTDNRRETHWDDKEVCKHFLVSFCPNELFTNTRADLGSCDKVHDDSLREQYTKSTRIGRMGFEEEFQHYLQSLLSDVERRIRRGYARLALNNTQGGMGGAEAADREEMVESLTRSINELVDEAEQLGCEGKVDEAQMLMKKCEELQEERTDLEQQQKSGRATIGLLGEDQIKKMEVCNVCGALLVAGDAQQRIDEHIMGKQHMGYARIRAYIESIRTKRDNELEEREKKAGVEREAREKEREDEREQRRQRLEEREKEREKEREERRMEQEQKSKEKEEKDKEKEEKEKEKDGEKKEDKDHDKKRSRSRSPDRRRRRSRSRDRRRRSRSRDRRHRRSRSRSRDRHSHQSSRGQDRDRPHRSRDHKSRDTSRDRDRKERDRKSREGDRKSRDSDRSDRKKDGASVGKASEGESSGKAEGVANGSGDNMTTEDMEVASDAEQQHNGPAAGGDKMDPEDMQLETEGDS